MYRNARMLRPNRERILSLSARNERVAYAQPDLRSTDCQPRLAYENPIQRPPHATPNHRLNDTSAVNRPASGRWVTRSVRITWRRTVNVKRSASRSDVIFTQNGKL